MLKMFLLKYVILSFALILAVDCASNDAIKENLFKLYKDAAITTRDFENKPVTYKNVTYYLYTIYNPYQFIQLHPGNLDLFAGTKIVFFIHGWTNSKNISWYEDLKNAFLWQYSDYYIVQVDWSGPANEEYYVSSINTFDVGKIIARLIVDLVLYRGANLESLLLIGHSLGGQITGFVGKEFYEMTGVKLPRIIALDPAGPLFTQRPVNERLNKEDAKVVEVIHTDGGTFGYEDPIGTIDFFPNGGSSQPGCWHVDISNASTLVGPISCDHHRAYQYFVKAILYPMEFIATKCSDWESYKAGKCDDNWKVLMGDIHVPARGNFYLATQEDDKNGTEGSTTTHQRSNVIERRR